MWNKCVMGVHIFKVYVNHSSNKHYFSIFFSFMTNMIIWLLLVFVCESLWRAPSLYHLSFAIYITLFQKIVWILWAIILKCNSASVLSLSLLHNYLLEKKNVHLLRATVQDRSFIKRGVPNLILVYDWNSIYFYFSFSLVRAYRKICWRVLPGY